MSGLIASPGAVTSISTSTSASTTGAVGAGDDPATSVDWSKSTASSSEPAHAVARTTLTLAIATMTATSVHAGITNSRTRAVPFGLLSMAGTKSPQTANATAKNTVLRLPHAMST